MGKRSILSGTAAALGMLVLILDSKTALAGAQEGVMLCLRTVIPSLFPFFVLSGILVASWMGAPFPLLRPLGRLLGMPKGSESLLISGFLGGYPVGAKCVRDTWKRGYLNKEDAQRLLCFCSNAGPAFLFGMVAPLFPDITSGWVLWGIHILSALLTGILFRENSASKASISPAKVPALTESLTGAMKVTAQVCGWVVVFRILSSFLERWLLWAVPLWMRSGMIGLLELSNGCISLAAVESDNLRFLLCSAMLAFGGLCVFLQTASVTRGLSMGSYLCGKLLQTLFSIVLSVLYLKELSPLWLIAAVLLTALGKIRKKSSIPEILRV